jgi:protein tyrosine phosphatase
LALSCEYANLSPSITPPPARPAQTVADIQEIAQKAIKSLETTLKESYELSSLDTVDCSQIFSKYGSFCTTAPWYAKGKYHPYNRYSDVAPNDECACTVGDDHTYFNGSSYYAANTSFILTQAPTKITLPHFKALISQHAIDTIVTLAMPVENGAKKGKDYWSALVPADHTEPREDGSQRIAERSLTIEGRQVRQFHYMNWPDRGIPKSELLFDLIQRTKDSTAPILVHCSAGIGRTGVFALASVLLKEKHPADKVPLIQRWMELRQCRPGMIQNAQQLQAVVEVLNLASSLPVSSKETHICPPSP